MIVSFRHKDLRQLHETGKSARLNPALCSRLVRLLDALDAAEGPDDFQMPGWRLHELSGDLNHFLSLSVNGNWRIIFRFEDGDVVDVDLLDYH
jgi:proteic killer suppression protein